MSQVQKRSARAVIRGEENQQSKQQTRPTNQPNIESNTTPRNPTPHNSAHELDWGMMIRAGEAERRRWWGQKKKNKSEYSSPHQPVPVAISPLQLPRREPERLPTPNPSGRMDGRRTCSRWISDAAPPAPRGRVRNVRAAAVVGGGCGRDYGGEGRWQWHRVGVVGFWFFGVVSLRAVYINVHFEAPSLDSSRFTARGQPTCRFPRHLNHFFSPNNESFLNFYYVLPFLYYKGCIPRKMERLISK